jgi:hypothetical protein
MSKNNPLMEWVTPQFILNSLITDLETRGEVLRYRRNVYNFYFYSIRRHLLLIFQQIDFGLSLLSNDDLNGDRLAHNALCFFMKSDNASGNNANPVLAQVFWRAPHLWLSGARCVIILIASRANDSHPFASVFLAISSHWGFAESGLSHTAMM